MGLYEAVHDILVTRGPLDAMYLERLPAEQVGDIDVAFVPSSGIGEKRTYGRHEIPGASWRAPDGNAHDGGVYWIHTGVDLQLRCRDGADPAMMKSRIRMGEEVAAVLMQYKGSPVVVQGETIVRCELTASPYFYEQDDRGRPIGAMTFEVWHRPATLGALT